MKDKTITEQEWFDEFTLEEKAMLFRRMLNELSKCRHRVFTSLDISYAINIVSTVFSQYQERLISDNQIQQYLSRAHIGL